MTTTLKLDIFINFQIPIFLLNLFTLDDKKLIPDKIFTKNCWKALFWKSSERKEESKRN